MVRSAGVGVSWEQPAWAGGVVGDGWKNEPWVVMIALRRIASLQEWKQVAPSSERK